MYTKHAVLRTARNAKEIRALAATLHPDPRWPYFTWILTVNRPRCHQRFETPRPVYSQCQCRLFLRPQPRRLSDSDGGLYQRSPASSAHGSLLLRSGGARMLVARSSPTHPSLSSAAAVRHAPYTNRVMPNGTSRSYRTGHHIRAVQGRAPGGTEGSKIPGARLPSPRVTVASPRVVPPVGLVGDDGSPILALSCH